MRRALPLIPSRTSIVSETPGVSGVTCTAVGCVRRLTTVMRTGSPRVSTSGAPARRPESAGGSAEPRACAAKP